MTATFQWMTQNVSMPDFDRAKVEAWLVEVAGTHGRVAHELSYVFCDDTRIIEVNREFLKHDYYTDIITFDYSHGRVISGDMFISLDTVASNAAEIGVEFSQELLRVIVHGVLHLCGINHKGHCRHRPEHRTDPLLPRHTTNRAAPDPHLDHSHNHVLRPCRRTHHR